MNIKHREDQYVVLLITLLFIVGLNTESPNLKTIDNKGELLSNDKDKYDTKIKQDELTTIQFTYHNYDKLTELLTNVSLQHPDLVELYSIGKSVQGRQLWVAMVTGKEKPNKEVSLKPHVKLIGNMHGNEPVGREILLQFLVYLVNSYSRDTKVKSLLDRTYIHLLPSINPDGFEMAIEGLCDDNPGRANANGFDLNRNFPDFFSPKNYNPEIEQPETRAARRWFDKFPFILSANLHGGALVASYPFDNREDFAVDGEGVAITTDSTSPDDDVYRHIANVYSMNHKTMHQGKPCPGDREGFNNGTTNGAAWYLLEGGLQDYNYYWNGCLEITFELSCCKYPAHRELPGFWLQNKHALLEFIEEAHRGVTGLVVGKDGYGIANAKLSIKGRNFNFKTSARGEFWRILLDGNYVIRVEAPGYKTVEKEFNVNKSQLTTLRIVLDTEGQK